MTGVYGMNSHQYRSSRDYTRLWQLLQNQPIVCIADWTSFVNPDDEPPRRDICSTNYSPSYGATICCRGVTYVMGDTADSFAKSCQDANIEFIEP